MHEVVDTGEQQPLAAAQRSDERVVERARVRLVTRDRPGRPLHDALARRDPAEELLAGGVGVARDTRDHALRVRGPAPARREGAGKREACARVRGVAQRLGDVPVTLAAGHRERVVRERLDDRYERGCDGAELERDGPGTPAAGTPTNLAPDAEQPALVHSSPRHHQIGCRGREVVVSGSWPRG